MADENKNSAGPSVQPPAWRRAQFPEQPKPLYQFLLKDGRLVRREHRHYQISKTNKGAAYRIYTPSGIKVKEQGQLDKVLNNHIWTFDPDPKKALGAFREKSVKDLVRACLLEQSARDLDYEIRKAEKQLTLQGPD